MLLGIKLLLTLVFSQQSQGGKTPTRNLFVRSKQREEKRVPAVQKINEVFQNTHTIFGFFFVSELKQEADNQGVIKVDSR